MDYSALWLGSGQPIQWHDKDSAHDHFKEVTIPSMEGKGKDEGKVKPICVLKGHSNDVTCVDFSGKNLLATGSLDKTIRLYKWVSGDTFEELPQSPLKGHKYGINSICFSPFGTKLASASTDGQTFIWNVKTGENMVALQSSEEAAGVRTCAFSPNSALLATGGDGDTAAVWDVSTLTFIREIAGHEATVTSVTFTPDSNYLATGSSNGDLKLWDGMYGHALPLVTKVEVHDLGITCLHFSPSIGKEESFLLGKQYLLASGGQDTDLHLWVVRVGSPNTRRPSGVDDNPTAVVRPHHTLCGHKAPIMTLKFSPNGMFLASASGDKTVRLWDVVRLVPLRVLEGHKRYVTSCAFSEDGELIAAGGGDRTTLVWRVQDATNPQQQPLSTFLPQTQNQRSYFPSQKIRESKELIHWSTSEVGEWLGEVGLAEYAPNFRSHLIDGREMISLTDVVLETKLGVDALGHRNRILRFIRKHSSDNADPVAGSGIIPKEFLCPITQEVMKDPVLCADGFSYEREAMEAWLLSGKRTSPMTNETLSHVFLTPNRTLRNLIQRHREENR